RAEVVIAEADVRRVTGLDVRFAPTGLALVGRAADGNSFRLTGSLAVAGSDALRFEPAVLEVAGGRAEGDLLKDLATPEERLIRVPLPAAGLRLVGVRCEEGRLVLVLTADPAVGVGETR
ncbi:MAG: hypothetical protein IRY95_03250, partial [Clostridia bacterium]|nr:hypothetical protein [Clostridia bacterium]